ncbi:Ig domain-containing protein [Clostridium sp. HBUAS56017]|uniref:Ig-like domain-containing protein n=1 Tax=Clostridium sp. HBUAS56017 TaxID=2571128 RepID=UPI001177ADC5|nr:Ig domain-containing protein [Clostridium sp. HBUAS56017]
MKNCLKKLGIIFIMLLVAVGIGAIQNGIVASAATVGKQLTAPEEGWQRIDDTNNMIIYNGTWSRYNGAGACGSSEIYTWTNNDSVQFKFYGTKIRILGSIASNKPTGECAEVYIDNIDCGKIFEHNDNPVYQTLVFENTSLNKGYHTVKIMTKNLALSNLNIAFDAIDIDSDGKLVTYTDDKPIVASKILLNKTTDNLQVGQADNLVATVTPDNVTNKNVNWTSNDPSIATVDSSGKVTALNAGTVGITATTKDGSNLSITCIVTVTELPSKIELNKTSDKIYVGQADTIIATTTPSNAGVTWASSDPSIATVDTNGKVTALKAGNVTITATTGNGITASCLVTVENLTESRIKLTIVLPYNTIKEYDLSENEFNAFMDWYNSRSEGVGKAYYIFDNKTKSDSSQSDKDYIQFDKIIYFNVKEYGTK